MYYLDVNLNCNTVCKLILHHHAYVIITYDITSSLLPTRYNIYDAENEYPYNTYFTR